MKTIKNNYRNGTYVLEYEGGKLMTDGNAPFTTLEETMQEDTNRMKLQLKQGMKLNDVLTAVMPKVNIIKLEEVIPTMNEIFIQTVGKTTGNE